MKRKKSEALEILVGNLMIIPFYLLVVWFISFNCPTVDLSIIMICCIYIPIILGAIIELKKSPNKVNKIIVGIAMILLTISLFPYYQLSYVNYTSFEPIVWIFNWVILIFISRICLFILYGIIHGAKNTFIFFGLYIASIILFFIGNVIIQ